MAREDGNPHYHIRWSRIAALDWQSFDTRSEAETRAKELSRRDETYAIEEHTEACPRCQTAMNLKTAHKGSTDLNSHLKYPWQQAVLDALTELRSEYLSGKVNVAQRAISARLCELTPADLDEKIAIRDALQNLRVLGSERTEPKHELGEKKPIA